MNDSSPPDVTSPVQDVRNIDRDDDEQMAPSAVQVTSQTGNDERGTPTQFIRRLHSAIDGLFDLDPCSGAEPTPIANTRFDVEDNGLAKDWTGYDTIYVNPPYSNLEDWMKKVTREASRDETDAPSLIIERRGEYLRL